MSKITTILDALVTRLETISTIRRVVKRPRLFAANECPGIAVYRGPTELIDHQEEGPAEYDLPVTVDYYREQAGQEDPSDRAETMVEELIAAVETNDWELCGTMSEPIYTLSDEVLLPEDGGDVIRATVVFNCRFIRTYGAA